MIHKITKILDQLLKIALTKEYYKMMLFMVNFPKWMKLKVNKYNQKSQE